MKKKIAKRIREYAILIRKEEAKTEKVETYRVKIKKSPSTFLMRVNHYRRLKRLWSKKQYELFNNYINKRVS